MRMFMAAVTVAGALSLSGCAGSLGGMTVGGQQPQQRPQTMAPQPAQPVKPLPAAEPAPGALSTQPRRDQ